MQRVLTKPFLCSCFSIWIEEHVRYEKRGVHCGNLLLAESVWFMLTYVLLTWIHFKIHVYNALCLMLLCLGTGYLDLRIQMVSTNKPVFQSQLNIDYWHNPILCNFFSILCAMNWDGTWTEGKMCYKRKRSEVCVRFPASITCRASTTGPVPLVLIECPFECKS